MKKYLVFSIVFFIVIVIMTLIAGIFAFWISLPLEPFSEEEIIFIIKEGEGLRTIARNLQNENLIKWAPLFTTYTVLGGMAIDLKAGEYTLSQAMNIPQIAEKFFRGEVIKKKITIIEGWDLRDIGFYFERMGMFQAEEVWELIGFPAVDYLKAIDLPRLKDFSDDFDFLKDKPKNLGLEGYLFPDTYEIKKGVFLEEIVEKMLDNFNRRLTAELKEEIKNQGKTIFEIVTMASLIEKEVRTLEDKKIVSGILWKRLETNFPLQVDATIAYVLGRRSWTFEEMRREVAQAREIDSPYNTYKYLGLPLGPIANPGLESIMAAVYPKHSEYWYYLSTPQGETIFSRTFEEHVWAKRKYLTN